MTMHNTTTGPSSAAVRLVSAAFVVPDAAERAIGALSDHGIDAGQISVAAARPEDQNLIAAAMAAAASAPDAASAHTDAAGFMEVQVDDPPTPTDMNAATEARLGASTVSGNTDSVIEAQGERGITTTTPADAAKGAVEGSLVGLGIGLLAGAAALTIPGVGLVLAAGPLWAALGGAVAATAGGAVAGGVTGYLKDMGVPASVAAQHEAALSAGSVIVAVHLDANDNADAVSNILRKYGGGNVTLHE
jgi:hypothetical protein